MASVAIKITIPSEDQLEPYYDIWDACEKAVTKIVERRVGKIPFTTTLLYSGSITDLANILGISYEEAKSEMVLLQEKYPFGWRENGD